MKSFKEYYSPQILVVVATSITIVLMYIAYKMIVSSVYRGEKSAQFNADIFKYLRDEKNTPSGSAPIIIPEASDDKPFNMSHFIWIGVGVVLLFSACIVVWWIFLVGDDTKQNLWGGIVDMLRIYSYAFTPATRPQRTSRRRPAVPPANPQTPPPSPSPFARADAREAARAEARAVPPANPQTLPPSPSPFARADARPEARPEARAAREEFVQDLDEIPPPAEFGPLPLEFSGDW
jgi:hypothetical protein